MIEPLRTVESTSDKGEAKRSNAAGGMHVPGEQQWQHPTAPRSPLAGRPRTQTQSAQGILSQVGSSPAALGVASKQEPFPLSAFLTLH